MLCFHLSINTHTHTRASSRIPHFVSLVFVQLTFRSKANKIRNSLGFGCLHLVPSESSIAMECDFVSHQHFLHLLQGPVFLVGFYGAAC